MRLYAFLSCRFIIVASALIFLTFPASAADTPAERNTLRGITELSVEVAPITPEAERDGLGGSQVQTDVELRLRQSGIRIVPFSFAVPCFTVRINTMKLPDRSSYVYTIAAELFQGVSLQRDPLILSYIATWNTGVYGAIGTQRVSELRSDVKDLVDQFINAYLKWNPKR